MTRYLAALFILLLALPAQAAPRAGDCERLVPLTTGKTLCFVPIKETNIDGYNGFFFSHDKLIPAPDGAYSSANPALGLFRIVDGHIIRAEAFAPLQPNSAGDKIIAGFYDTLGIDGEKVFFSDDTANATKQPRVYQAPDGDYKTVAGTGFSADKGYLLHNGEAYCTFEPATATNKETISCENRD